jgi:hypothetical protein
MEINNNQPQPEQELIPIQNSLTIESIDGWKLSFSSNELTMDDLLVKADWVKKNLLNKNGMKPSPTYTQ